MTADPTPRAEADVPYRGRFLSSRAERLADGLVHAVGIVLAIAAGATLLALAAGRTGPGEYAAAVFYVVSLVTVLGISLAYNMWPLSPAKWVLRRIDHAAIYLLIAGTYSPFLARLDPPSAWTMLGLVWGAAALGMSVKLFLPGRFDRVAVAFYLAIGWSGLAVAGELTRTLPASTIGLILAGGIAYSSGVVFFARQRLRFQAAVWHGFVVSGAGLHLAAVMDLMVVNGS